MTHGDGAVSYTHLDVYKRQVQLRAYNGQIPASLRLQKVDEKTGQGLKNAVFSLYRKAKAVSYTHLDVYKRQA